jgi:hypothetical protein
MLLMYVILLHWPENIDTHMHLLFILVHVILSDTPALMILLICQESKKRRKVHKSDALMVQIAVEFSSYFSPFNSCTVQSLH